MASRSDFRTLSLEGLAAGVLVSWLAWPSLSPGARAILLLAGIGAPLLALVALARTRPRQPLPAGATAGDAPASPAYTREPAPAARRRVPGRVRATLAGAAVLALMLTWLVERVRVSGGPSAPPLWLLLALSAGLLVAALVIFSAPGMRRRQSLAEVSSGGGAAGLDRWRAEVPGRWHAGMWAGAAPKLARRAEPEDEYDDGPRRITAVATIVDQPAPVPGGLAFGVDTSDAWAVGEDVAESAELVRRVIGASVALVEPVHAVPTFVVVTAYRGQPYTGRRDEPLVSWHSIGVAEDPDMIQVGETAYANLLGSAELVRSGGVREAVQAIVRDRSLRSARAALTARPTLAGRPAELPGDGSVILFGARKAGKTGGVRAIVRGHVVRAVARGEYLRLYVVNNKGDFAGLRQAAEATGGRYGTSDVFALDVLRELDDVAERRYAAQGEAYEHDPSDPAAPRCLLVIAELLKLGASLGPNDKRELDRLLLKVATTHRAAAVQFVTCSQLAEKRASADAGVGPVRDACHSVALYMETAGQAKMALDDAAVRRGAAPHTIPKAARGVFYALDAHTDWPFLARFGWIPAEDQHVAITRPLLAMAERMPHGPIIDGELAGDVVDQVDAGERRGAA